MSFLLVGLGNPGGRFTGTRHNLGIEVLRQWIEHSKSSQEYTVSDWKAQDKYQAEIAEIVSNDWQAVCLFPTTYMNESGHTVAEFLRNHNIPYDKILIIHDDIELPLGKIERVDGGSARGHKGVRSIFEALDTQDVPRLRLGVGRPAEGSEITVDRFVLSRFSESEKKTIEDGLLQEALEAISAFVSQT